MAGKQQRRGGRYTPPKGSGPGRPRSESSSRPAPEPPPQVQVGRRPSPPWFLFLIAALWVAGGVVSFVRLDAAWKLVPTIVFVGIGLFYLRAALQTVVRRGGHGDGAG